MKGYLESWEKAVAKNGSEYVKAWFVLEDKSKRQFWIWDRVDEFISAVGDAVVFDLHVNPDPQFPKIVGFSPAGPEFQDPHLYFSFAFPSDSDAVKFVMDLVGNVKNPLYRKIIDCVLSMPFGGGTVLDQFAVIPAAKGIHHCRRHGLVSHTAEVMRYCAAVLSSKFYGPSLDSQVVLAGAFLHDVGKVWEYSFAGPDAAVYGHSVGNCELFLGSHLEKGAELVAVAFDRLVNAGDPDALAPDAVARVDHLRHVIMCHHLQRDWAAVNKPLTLEALLVFQGDYFSAAFGKFNSIDWSGKSGNDLLGDASKYDSFLGFTPVFGPSPVC